MRTTASFVIRLAIGITFLYAGVIKALAPVDFFHSILKYDLVSWRPLVISMAFYLPWLEIVCGAALVLKQSHAALVLLLAMTSVFTAAIASAMIRGLDISCGCFGHASHGMPVELGIDIAILGGLLFLFWARKEQWRSVAAF